MKCSPKTRSVDLVLLGVLVLGPVYFGMEVRTAQAAVGTGCAVEVS